MKLIYLSSSRLPTEKAHGFTQCKMCESLGRLGLEVELWYPKRKTWIEEDLFDWYGLDRCFKTKEFWWWDSVGVSSRVPRAWWMCWQASRDGRLVMTRNHMMGRFLKTPFVFEKHSPCVELDNCIGVYDATELGSPVDPREFDLETPVRKMGRKTIGFVGNFSIRGEDKGRGLFTKVARNLNLSSVVISRMKREYALKEMRRLDVGFIGPYPEGTHRGLGKAHPVKLREYMYAGVPVVAHAGSIWPRPHFVWWVEEPTVRNYVEATKQALDSAKGFAFIKRAREEALEWTWEKGGQEVIRLIDEWLVRR